MTAEDLVKLIRKRYPMRNTQGYEPYVVLEQVPDGTGQFQNRWIDAVAFSLWKSKGLDRYAFEVKISRSDFIQELQNPLKHQWALECFHEFWFVAPKEVIQLEELPVGVGWMYPHGDKLAIKRHAVRNPTPKLDDVLLAGFMRAAGKEIRKARKATADEILKDSKDYQTTKAYMDATLQFIENHHKFPPYEPTKENIIAKIEEAIADPQMKKDLADIAYILDNFQRDITHLFSVFALIANKSLFARNETGKILSERFGDAIGIDTIEAIKERARSGYGGDERYAQLVDLIMNWGELIGDGDKK